MWSFLKRQHEAKRDDDPPHPLALRIYEIEQSIERGFWGHNGGKVAGAFAVVAQMLAEQEARIQALEEQRDA